MIATALTQRTDHAVGLFGRAFNTEPVVVWAALFLDCLRRLRPEALDQALPRLSEERLRRRTRHLGYGSDAIAATFERAGLAPPEFLVALPSAGAAEEAS